MKWINNNSDKILIVFILLFFISDVFTNLSLKLTESSFSRYSGFVKLVFELLMLITIIINLKKTSNSLFIFISIIFFFLLGQILYYSSNHYVLTDEILFKNIYYFNRYVYILIFILYVESIAIKSQTFYKIYQYFEYVLVINSVFIIVGYFTNLNLFRSYASTERFGFSGILSKPGETSFLYVIAIIKNYFFWVKNKDIKSFYKVLFFILVSLFIGKKMILLFLFFLFLYHFLFNNKHKKWYRIITLFTIPLLFYTKEYILNKLLVTFPFWKKIADENGVLTAITSNRNRLLIYAINDVNNNWNIWNYLFGSIDFLKFKTEFEFVDFFLLMGVTGVLFYLYIVYNNFLKYNERQIKTLVIIVFMTSFFTGGLLLNVTAILMFYITINYVLKMNLT